MTSAVKRGEQIERGWPPAQGGQVVDGEEGLLQGPRTPQATGFLTSIVQRTPMPAHS
jgi:hypothetical protein